MSSRASKRDPSPSQPAQETLQQILERFDIRDCQLLLVGDGSGNSWNACCGWATTMIEMVSRERWLFYGAMSAGSINLAELAPYVQALSWYHQDRGKNKIHELGRPIRVNVITDSEVVATQGKQTADFDQPLPKANSPQWAAMRQFARLGYQLHWHHEGRSQTVLNWAADLLAGISRRQLQGKAPSLTIDTTQLERLRVLAADCKMVAMARPDQVESEQSQQLLRASLLFEELLRTWTTAPTRAASSLDAVALRDPVSGSSIDLQHLNPDQSLLESS